VVSSKNNVLDAIWKTVPIGAVIPTDPKTLAILGTLTQQLIDLSGRAQLAIDPFQDVYQRQVPIDEAQVTKLLRNKVVLVTGGRGFVGTHLVDRLQALGVSKIITVDIAPAPAENSNPIVSHQYCDVRDLVALQAIFAQEKPQIVFHLAAQRLPGLAETAVYETVSTNLFGSENIIELCEAYRVETCIFSSTGKASRYFTPDIYAASKKIAEWLFSDRAWLRSCQYGIVRFTHVVENSPVSAEIEERVAQGIVSLHAPFRYIYAQNIQESVNLLLLALTSVRSDHCRLISVRDLGWPIDILDVALHKIVVANKPIPLYFKGIPLGYEQHVFLGQIDLSGQQEALPMLNVLETCHSQVSPANNTVAFRLPPWNATDLEHGLSCIRQSMGSADNAKIRQALIQCLKAVVLSSFRQAPTQQLEDILRWGTNSKELAAAEVDISYHQETIDLLMLGLQRVPLSADLSTSLC
jgi:Polysaccharide biosynthesis protein